MVQNQRHQRNQGRNGLLNIPATPAKLMVGDSKHISGDSNVMMLSLLLRVCVRVGACVHGCTRAFVCVYR
eukprot:5690116-Lingulodinium_polyedra.AAC.1